MNHTLKKNSSTRRNAGLASDGARLAQQAFSPNDPHLVLSESAAESGQNDQKGFLQIFAGSDLGTFALADDAQADPPDRPHRALSGREDASCFWILPEGEGRQVSPLGADIVLNT